MLHPRVLKIDVLTSYTGLMEATNRNAPGRVRDAIFKVLSEASTPLSTSEIAERVKGEIGEAPTSSIRSYLRLNTPDFFVRESRGVYRIRNDFRSPRQKYFEEMREPEVPSRFKSRSFITTIALLGSTGNRNAPSTPLLQTLRMAFMSIRRSNRRS